MKIKFFILFVLIALLLSETAFGQTKRQRQKITQHYGHEKLNSLSAQYQKRFQEQKSRAYAYAEAHNFPVVIKRKNGQNSYLSRIDHNGNLIYIKSYLNIDAAKTINAEALYSGGTLGLQLAGKGMTAGVWDGGKVNGDHELLKDKVTQKDDPDEYDDHATHVAGTMVGKDIMFSNLGRLSRGVAYKANLDAYDWDDDISEMYEAARDGLLVSNHSYGTDLSQSKRRLKEIIGAYDERSEAVDNLMYQAPNYVVVNAAGNDRDEELNEEDGGYNLLAADMSTAKNTLVIAAVDKVLDYSGPSSVKMTDFSSWGPTIDNRVKPDISADGLNVLSSVAKNQRGNSSNKSYALYSGTSSASPSVAAGILLLQELSADLHDDVFLKSATIKALIIETVRQASETPGPDPRYGWGLIDLEKAAQLMLENEEGEESFLDELTLYENEPYIRTVEARKEGDLKITIAWTDPPGEVQKGGDDAPVLVNDLDMRVTNSKGKTFYPWRLDEHSFSAPAVNDGDNAVDNVEQIVIPDAVKGEEYTITINHEKELENDKQDFSIAGFGFKSLDEPTPEESEFILYPNPTSDYVNLYKTDTGKEVRVTVYDFSGRTLIDQEYKGQLTFNQSLDISHLATGIYFVRLTTNGEKSVKKLLVQ